MLLQLQNAFGVSQRPPASKELRHAILADQIDTVCRLIPGSLITNCLVALGLAAYFWRQDRALGFALFAVISVLQEALSFVMCWKWRNGEKTEAAVRRGLLIGTVSSAATALRIGAFGIAVFPFASMSNQLLLGCVMTAVFSTCIGLGAVRQFTFAFGSVLAACCVTGLLISGAEVHRILAAMISLYCFFLVTLTFFFSRMVEERARVRLTLAQERNVTEMLLADFESDATDILWETNAVFHLTHISERLEELLGRSAAQLANDRLGNILGEIIHSDSRTTLLELSQRFAKHEAFRGALLSVNANGKRRWLVTSGKPVYGSHQQFIGYRGVANDITDKREAENRLHFLAMHDALTGLPNRASFEKALDKAAEVDHPQHAVLCLDLDNFKTVNDSFGHEAGDHLLIEIGKRITQVAGKGAVVSRLSGDEFAILVTTAESTTREKLEALGGDLCTAIAKPVQLPNGTAHIGASVGIAAAREHGVLNLMLKADAALYDGKREGKNRYSFFSQAMVAKAERRHKLEKDIPQALARGEFFLEYQPIVHAVTHKPKGFEALVRWRHSQLGLIPPLDFIPVAEDTGKIGVLGEWILREACKFAASWAEPLRIAVNISPRQVARKDFGELVSRILRETGLEAHRLELEITESAYLGSTPETRAMFEGLHELGVHLSLDDFGTGYSSLSHLRDVPFSRIKIDRSFVRALPEDDRDLAIVRAMVALATSMGKGIVAEGVETDEHSRCLLAQGCHELQGYHFSRPVSAATVASLISPHQDESASA